MPDGIAYGGDWNPEQWSEETWEQDVALMREAGVNRVSVGIFSWSSLEPVEGVFDFGWFDRVMDLLAENGIGANLATPTASPPPWFSDAYPQALPVDADGRRLHHGSRQGFCPSSPIYREKALRIAEQVALRYRDHPALALWHVHNEYGCHNARCYCDTSAAAFRAWLRARYDTLDALNEAWGTAFWSQRYSDWAQILPPRATPSFPNPGQQLDFRRFSSDALVELYRAERDLLRQLTPDVPATTNLMAGAHWDMDCWAFAAELDVVSTDHYLIGARRERHIDLAFAADYARSLNGGRPWLLMEHSTSAVNWQPRNLAKAPGELRRNSLSHLARGADGIMFFQWRQSRAGAEKWHSAMLPHAGTDTKIWREVVALGAELAGLGDVAGSTVTADVALLLDHSSVWAQDHPAQPTAELDPVEEAKRWHAALWRAGVTCDLAHPEGDLSGYRLVVVPQLYLVSDEGAANLEEFARRGGAVVVGPYSGIVDEHDRVRLGGYPGAWRDLLGVSVEEFLPLDAPIRLASGATGSVWSEAARVTTAKVLDTYATGEPAWTRNEFGDGFAHYLTTLLDDAALAEVLATACREAGVAAAAAGVPGLEVVRRSHPDGRSFLFAINHTAEDADVTLDGGRTVTVAAGDAVVIPG
ncbi:beta-galactosidase [Nonomuraea gerenzanensis]|uniref:Beta-galactosidase n=1 Tax=Nonomuraea gerenzanensis TaxID=93944 RepID=A0A1M4EI85_9ACTN|nr:beta-galactosidase [Nonomuraea gerenzanensis]UBU09835.1 beta-galactosidase [Nonomuraea gerenzanensis]SBO98283.1 Beta-galactosidase [Nonomuraea gerenzanensis]